MRELAVGTQTTPVELASLMNDLLPDDIVCGRPGADGAVVLHAASAAWASWLPASSQEMIAARVAIDVVLQQVDGMPGARSLAGYVRKQLAGGVSATAGLLAPPLTLLATLYTKTGGPMQGGPAQSRMAPLPTSAWSDSDGNDPLAVTPEQRQALETLLDKLMQLPCRSKQPDRQ